MWRRRTLGLAACATVLLAATSTPVSDAVPGGPGAPAAEAVAALADPDRLATEVHLPADFATIMGYEPFVEQGSGERSVLSRPDGSCSSPLGDTRYGFGQACRVHDLGYDLLRYAALTGQPLGPAARRALDAAFGESMRAVCAAGFDGADLVGCLGAAATYEGIVVINSWRQAFGTPLPEPLWAVVAPFVPVATALAGTFRRRRRRTTRRRMAQVIDSAARRG